MRAFNTFLLLLTGLSVIGQTLPDGVTVDSTKCKMNKDKFSYTFSKNKEMIGLIQPGTCHHDNVYDDFVDNNFYADFYKNTRRDTFATSREAMKWMATEIKNFYKPDIITKWKKLKVQPPKVSLEYPWDWTYQLGKSSLFDSKSQSENKLVLKDTGGSEIIQIIRTPNTAKYSTKQIMDLSALMNRAIDFKQNPTVDIVINGKTFKTMEHAFMDVMLQRHYWYADENEIIYIGYGLLKEQKIKYPQTVKHIVEKITW